MLIEASTYRYYGHSLSDPRNEYRTKEEEAAWRAIDAIENLKGQLIAAGVADAAGVAAVEQRVRDRNARAAIRVSQATDPAPETRSTSCTRTAPATSSRRTRPIR